MNEFITLKSIAAILPDHESAQTCDILIRKKTGLIEEIKPEVHCKDSEEISSYGGMLAMAGFIDPHVHFRTPGKTEAEDWSTGSLAALSAGVSTVLDMPNTSPPTTNEEGLSIKLSQIKKDSLVNYGLFGGLTKNNLDFLLKKPDIKAIKVYMASTTGDLLIENLNPQDFSQNGKLFCFHAEDESIIRSRSATLKLTSPIRHSEIRCEQAAIEGVRKVIDLQKITGGNFHVAHVSTSKEMEMLQDSAVSFECAPHHIFCSTDEYQKGGFLWKCNPPLRQPSSRDEMIGALHGQKIQMIATDHAPHPLSDKTGSNPASGLPSLEVGSHFILNEMVQGKISPGYATAILSGNAAGRFKIQNRGLLKEGYFADIAIIQNKRWTFSKEHIFSKCGWSPFLDYSFAAKVVATFVNGTEFCVDRLKNNLYIEDKKRYHKIYQV